MTNEAASYVAEYMTRRRLSKLGYRFDPSKLDCLKAEVFSIISVEIDKIESKEIERSRRG